MTIKELIDLNRIDEDENFACDDFGVWPAPDLPARARYCHPDYVMPQPISTISVMSDMEYELLPVSPSAFAPLSSSELLPSLPICKVEQGASFFKDQQSFNNPLELSGNVNIKSPYTITSGLLAHGESNHD